MKLSRPVPLLITGLVLVLIGVLVLLSNRQRTVNLLNGTWNYMPGVTVQADRSLQVHHTGLAILQFADNDHPDSTNSTYVANPPVNLFGTHLDGIGTVTAKLSHVTSSTTLSLYSAPPVRYDERLVRQPGVDIAINDNTLTVSAWATPGAKPQIKTAAIATASQATIVVSQSAGQLNVVVNGTTVVMPLAPLSKQIWFGLDTTKSFQLDSLQASGHAISAIDTAQKGAFQASAARQYSKQFGTAVDLTALMGDPNYTKFVVANFNEVETEMLAKFQALQPEQGQYEFGELDALVAFGNQHNLTVHGHALIFGEAYPQWLQQQLATDNRDQATQLLQDHITRVIQRYDGKHGHGTIAAWDVVNEPLSADDPTQLATYNLWYKALGPDYIKLAFQTARAANPNGIYGINENGMEVDPARAAAMLALVQQVNADGKLIDFVGYQAHFDEDTLDDDDAMAIFNNNELSKQFAAYAAIGVKVRISEATVALNDDPDTQADVYGKLAAACQQAPNCFGFNLWGATNSTASYFYNTGDITEKDPGDDAPTTQSGQGAIKTRVSWRALLDAISS